MGILLTSVALPFVNIKKKNQEVGNQHQSLLSMKKQNFPPALCLCLGPSGTALFGLFGPVKPGFSLAAVCETLPLTFSLGLLLLLHPPGF